MIMKRATASVAIVLLLSAGALAYANRTTVRDWMGRVTKSPIPAAKPFAPSIVPAPTVIPAPPSVVEGGIATSSHYTLESSPTSAPPVPQVKQRDPFVDTGPLPEDMNLDVPFTTQSPYATWTPQDEESCEEAAALMVDAYYRGVREITKADAKKTLDAVVAYEMKTFGFFKDTSSTTTAAFLRGYFGYPDVRVVPFDFDKMQRAVVNGYPVILPTAGKLLLNPNFKNGGPPYHMVVVKGYTADGTFITNDPGTRNGKDYIYTRQILSSAVHDWNNGDVTNGTPLMIIVMPKT